MITNVLQRNKDLFLSTYKRIPIEIVYGDGVHLFDKSGERYLDMFSGLGVNALGYSFPKIVEVVSRQIGKFGHLSNNYLSDIQIEFTEKLLLYSGMSKAFLTNSGAEAIEGAVKLIRLKYGPDKKIFSLSKSFHGRTYAAMTLTGNSKYKSGFEPLVNNIEQIDFNDVADLRNKISENTCAIFLEFLQGEGGINEVSLDFVNTLSDLKNKFDFLVVSDGIQCGTGRTGKPYSHSHYNIEPDIIVTAKAIGGGLPLGAILVKEELADIFPLGKHGSTFGGNPVCCAAGKVVLEEVYENGLMDYANDTGIYFKSQLENMKTRYSDSICEVRGRGLMIGVELKYAGVKLVEDLFRGKILSNCTAENVIRILPPLIINKNEIDYFLYNFEELIKIGQYGN